MNGMDLTPEQLDSASDFVLARRTVGDLILPPDSDSRISIRWDELVRVVAWYGAMRYVAGRDQIGGTLEIPGEFVVTKHSNG